MPSLIPHRKASLCFFFLFSYVFDSVILLFVLLFISIMMEEKNGPLYDEEKPIGCKHSIFVLECKAVCNCKLRKLKISNGL